jgi:hypothetical protein
MRSADIPRRAWAIFYDTWLAEDFRHFIRNPTRQHVVDRTRRVGHHNANGPAWEGFLRAGRGRGQQARGTSAHQGATRRRHGGSSFFSASGGSSTLMTQA